MSLDPRVHAQGWGYRSNSSSSSKYGIYAFKFSRTYFYNHISESIHTWTIEPCMVGFYCMASYPRVHAQESISSTPLKCGII